MANKDPYRYFRIEARELLDALQSSLRALPDSAERAAEVARLLRTAHTLKGAARVVKALDMAEAAHRLETRFADYREGAEVPAPVLGEAGEALRGLEADLERLLQPAPPAPAGPQAPAVTAGEHAPAAPAAVPAPAPSGDRSLQSVRVAMEDLDGLLEGVVDAGLPMGHLELALGTLGRLAAELEQSPADQRAERAQTLGAELRRLVAEFGQHLDQARGGLHQLRQQATGLRLLPASLLFDSLQETLDDACGQLGRQAELVASGGEYRLDAHILQPLRDGLIQIVRNAISHGIEPPALRRERGKPERGRVDVQVSPVGDRILIRIRDDGAGIDLEAVRRLAVERGRLDAATAPSASEATLVSLLLEGGLSTARELTAISGRGVGLDLLREAVRKASGDLRVRTAAGEGTEFLIEVPPSLVAMEVLVVGAGALRVCLPMHQVRRAIRLPRSALEEHDEGTRVVIDGRPLAARRLASWDPDARPDEQGAESRNCSVLLLASGEQEAVLEVDQLVASREAVVRPLPAYAGSAGLAIGASPDLNGDPLPILDVHALIEAIIAAGPERARPPTQRLRYRVLVIDDSLTTRMMEQSILESEGYEVDLAESAERALELVRQNPYQLFVCDVEMPGMSGFEFVARTREDPVLRRIPAILVTSLSRPEDRQRGLASGASDYIVKGEFDQGYFLDVVRRLVREGVPNE
ncbi:hybrid sensor histidine kinase/response regulator [Pseudomarimonas salicorniae]|uniref:histidine kinase n=1 Tax=Pseudomarimonas salicorniae TaxID=2933270 RepID=A0ABT0GFP5_9GAMM|nr:response regulator [Lysobacter sp. CAU 1642]